MMVTPTYAWRLAHHGLDLDPAGQHAVSWPSACRAATTANITISTALNAGDTLDGVTLAAGDRVLVKDQSTGSQNGIYIVGASPARAEDYDTSRQIVGSVVIVSEGTANAGTAWRQTAAGPITLGSTAIAYTAFGSGGGGTPDLESVLTAGNDTGGTAIVADDPSLILPSRFDLGPPDVKLASGFGDVGENGGDIDIQGGGGDGEANGAEIFIPGGDAGGEGSNIEVYPGWATTGSGQDGGDILLSLSSGDGGGRQGLLIVENLPTSDPGISNALWNDSGTLKVSP